jgi:hypothetical protein
MLKTECLFERGSGIGTRLFPWARCTIFSKINSISMLSPNWVQPRIGPLLRGGIDLNAYHRQILLLGLFSESENMVSGFNKYYTKCLYGRLPEPEDFKKKLAPIPNGNSIITFSGDGGRFANLNGMDQLLYKYIREITKSKWLEFADSFTSIPIGINIRLGNDFKTPSNIDDHYTNEATKTSVQWFVQSLKFIRMTLGFNAPAYVVTDGSAEDISELLLLPNTHFVRPGCAISDLLILSKAKVLLRSGGSSFSAWASFLGQMPTISHEGQSMKEFNMINKYGYYTGEFMPNNPNPIFAKDLRKIFE